MPINLRYNEINQILYVKVDKQVDLIEFKSTLNNITNSKDYPATVFTLWDTRALDFSKIDSDFIKHASYIHNKYSDRKKAKVAIVVKDHLGFGMSRMYQLYAFTSHHPENFQIFYDHQDGENWLLWKTKDKDNDRTLERNRPHFRTHLKDSTKGFQGITCARRNNL